MRMGWREIGVMALTAVVVMAIVGRWPAARRVILPPEGVAGVPVVAKQPVVRRRRVVIPGVRI